MSSWALLGFQPKPLAIWVSDSSCAWELLRQEPSFPLPFVIKHRVVCPSRKLHFPASLTQGSRWEISPHSVFTQDGVCGLSRSHCFTPGTPALRLQEAMNPGWWRGKMSGGHVFPHVMWWARLAWTAYLHASCRAVRTTTSWEPLRFQSLFQGFPTLCSETDLI